MNQLSYGHQRLAPTEAHVAGYGARLIFEEVMDGGRGRVSGRQDAFGSDEDIAVLEAAVDEWRAKVRREVHPKDSGSTAVVELRTGRVLVRGSAQQSYGYLYVTALLEAA